VYDRTNASGPAERIECEESGIEIRSVDGDGAVIVSVANSVGAGGPVEDTTKAAPVPLSLLQTQSPSFSHTRRRTRCPVRPKKSIETGCK
jgi:hypothetical protein